MSALLPCETGKTVRTDLEDGRHAHHSDYLRHLAQHGNASSIGSVRLSEAEEIIGSYLVSILIRFILKFDQSEDVYSELQG